MLTALEAASAVIAPEVPILGEVSAVVGAAAAIVKLTVMLLPYIKEGAICIKNGVVIVTDDLEAEAQKLILDFHKL